jgi:Asp-tRNA(Asn)/Glu-tRNA(Gln) amidotransferase A subunit family amidase
VFEEFDAIVTPAAKGAAPLHEEGTGSAVFAAPWTLMGVPALNLPLLGNDMGLPIGVQLVGARLNDCRLMRTARWLVDELDKETGEG